MKSWDDEKDDVMWVCNKCGLKFSAEESGEMHDDSICKECYGVYVAPSPHDEDNSHELIERDE